MDSYLRKAITDHGMTQTSFAAVMDVKQPTVHRWITGKARIPAERVNSICSVLPTLTPSQLRPDVFGQ